MKLEDYLEFVAQEQIRIRGHRIGNEHVVERFRQGPQPEEIRRSFPSLSLEQIYATLTYDLRNRDEIDAYMAQQHEVIEEEFREAPARGSEVVERLRAMQAERRRARSSA